MELEYIDIHSHLNLSPLRENKEAVVAKMYEKSVGTIVIGVDIPTSHEAIALSKQFDSLYAGVGLHPTDNTAEDFSYHTYQQLAQEERVVCIGECGLDYFKLTGSEEEKEKIIYRQKEVFKKHIELAIEVSKPLMIHARPTRGSMNAYEDVLGILERYFSTLPHYATLRGNFHFYVGDMETTKKILELGFTMSFDGPITFSHDYNEVIRFIPLTSMHAETDAPFAAPVPYRGKTAEPWMVTEIVKKIAEIKEIPLAEVISTLRANARRDFGI